MAQFILENDHSNICGQKIFILCKPTQSVILKGGIYWQGYCRQLCRVGFIPKMASPSTKILVLSETTPGNLLE